MLTKMLSFKISTYRGEQMPKLKINGQEHEIDVPDDMPLLWVLRDVVGLTGTKFGCGIALCGACTVHVDERPMRSCITPVSSAAGKEITTIEAIGTRRVGLKSKKHGSTLKSCSAATASQARSCLRQRSWRAIQVQVTAISMLPCRAIYAGAARIHASVLQ